MKKLINFIKNNKIFFFIIGAIALISIVAIELHKEYMAQRLCKHAEYDFCHVKTYEIVIK